MTLQLHLTAKNVKYTFNTIGPEIGKACEAQTAEEMIKAAKLIATGTFEGVPFISATVIGGSQKFCTCAATM